MHPTRISMDVIRRIEGRCGCVRAGDARRLALWFDAETDDVWRIVATSAVSVIVIIFLPITLVGLMLPVNDYQAQGMSSLAECDGPGVVMLLVGPSLAAYAAGAIYYAVLLKGPRRGVLMVLCVVMMAAAGGKAWAAYQETTRPVHQRTCGEGW